jgi:broad specificity phosphatase PhoE
VTRLFLVRHGNTFEKGETPVQVGSRTDLPLTLKGRAQAEHLGEFFSREGIRPSAIFTGPLRRQKETAAAIARKYNLQVLPEAALNEIDYGLWEGLTSQEISDRWPSEYRKWIEDGEWAASLFEESLEERLVRIRNFLSKIRGLETVIAVGSNGILRYFHPSIPKGEMEKFKVRTGAYCELLLNEEQVEVVRWNLLPDQLS